MVPAAEKKKTTTGEITATVFVLDEAALNLSSFTVPKIVEQLEVYLSQGDEEISKNFKSKSALKEDKLECLLVAVARFKPKQVVMETQNLFIYCILLICLYICVYKLAGMCIYTQVVTNQASVGV